MREWMAKSAPLGALLVGSGEGEGGRAGKSGLRSGSLASSEVKMRGCLLHELIRRRRSGLSDGSLSSSLSRRSRRSCAVMCEPSPKSILCTERCASEGTRGMPATRIGLLAAGGAAIGIGDGGGGGELLCNAVSYQAVSGGSSAGGGNGGGGGFDADDGFLEVVGPVEKEGLRGERNDLSRDLFFCCGSTPAGISRFRTSSLMSA